jgi:hypothetical protein
MATVPRFITLAQAKEQLRMGPTPNGSPGDDALTDRIVRAEMIICDYLAASAYWQPIIEAWTTDTIPPHVVAAMLLELGELDRFRGDDPDAPERWADHDLSPAIVGLLRRTRDPVVV